MSKKRRHSDEMDRREFINIFSEYEGQTLLDSHGKVNAEDFTRLNSDIERHLARIDQALKGEVDPSDLSVYTGTTGIALLYLHLHNTLNPEGGNHYLLKAEALLERPLRHLKRRKFTFLCGDGGPLAVAAVVFAKLGKSEESEECVHRLCSRHTDVLNDHHMPNELLYGRAGYLYALLFVQKHLGPAFIDPAIVEKITRSIIDSGKELSRRERSICPLMYEWHDKKYLGAAHGLAGIFHTLLLVSDSKFHAEKHGIVKESIDYCMTLRYASGNFPSSMGNTSDRLIHWCHGAPGWVHLFLLAYRIYGETKYLEEAKSCGEVVWTRGLLRKGYGLCHGVAGNAYAFLNLYQHTGDKTQLHRALKFSAWCSDYGKHGCRIPDRPFSLFEGLAGTVYFLADVIEPKKAHFPAFQL